MNALKWSKSNRIGLNFRKKVKLGLTEDERGRGSILTSNPPLLSSWVVLLMKIKHSHEQTRKLDDRSPSEEAEQSNKHKSVIVISDWWNLRTFCAIFSYWLLGFCTSHSLLKIKLTLDKRKVFEWMVYCASKACLSTYWRACFQENTLL